ncbi:alkyl sulfatase dimerization domain-containing protein [Bacteroides hominis (ex Liu et al. 2022)]|nr:MULTISPECIES: alkyl sulfatase dimerization domain-containing protein [Bacteroides]MDV6144415.1 alkyl sulfatase dimerization domain-containing protein [Bacteroides hominis (ex Liu et al. 2022)]
MIKLPESIDKQFYNRGYYGTVSHNVKAQYQLYYGWFDGNPANLNPLPPSEQGKKYVERWEVQKECLKWPVHLTMQVNIAGSQLC